MPIYEYDNIDVETPDVVSDEVLHVYIPKATYDSPGIAKFNSKYFNVDNGEVKIKDIYAVKTEVYAELAKKATKEELKLGLDGKVSKDEIKDILNITQEIGDSTTAVMSQKAVTDELYSEVALTWENGSINGSSGIDAESTSTVCRALGYFDVRTIHSISVIKAKQLFYYDENKKYIGNTAIAKNSTIYKADILALGDVGYVRLRSAWGESAETVDKVTFYEDVKVKTAIEQSDKVDEKYSAYTIKECPMNWKPFFYNVTTGVCGDIPTPYFVSGDRIRLSEFIKAETGNKLYFRIYVYADDGSYIGYLGDMARGGTLYQKDIYSVYSNASEIILSMYYSSNIVTPVADVEQYTTVYCTATATERATEDYWRKQRQRFNNKPIMIAYSQTDLGYINTELAYVNHAIAGFRWLKGDVQPTSDGKLIMCHDDGFTFDNNGYITAYNATSENTRVIHDMTYEECMASEYAKEYHIRTEYGETTTKITYRPKVCDLEKFLIVCKEYEVRPYIVIRQNYMDVVVPELLQLLEAYDFLDNCIVNSFTLASVAEVARQSNHRVMISVVKEYAQGTYLTTEEIDNLLAVSPNCTINAYTGSTTTAWNNALLADASKNAIKYAKSLGVVVGTAFVQEPQPLFERGIGLMQCSTLCVPMKVTPINLCVSLKDGVATVVRKGAYGAEFTADVAISGKKIQLYNIRKLGSTRDFSDGVTPLLAEQMPYSLTATGDNVTSTNLAWNDVIEIVFDTNIANLDTSSEKKIYVKFAYGQTEGMSQKATTDEINALKSDLVDFKTNQPNLFVRRGANILDESLLVNGKRLLSDGKIDNLASCCATESFIDISNIKDSHLAAYYTAFDDSPIRCCYRLSFYSVADVSGHLKTYSCNSVADLSIAICEIPNGANFVRVSYAQLTTSVYHFMLISGKSDMELINYEKWYEKITVVPADLNEQLANINEQIARSSYQVHHDNAEFTITKLRNSYTFNQNDFTFVKDELWLAKNNPADFSNGTGIFRHKWDGEKFVHVGTINCDFGHLNVVDYCEANDCLIFGNGANDTSTESNYFVVVPNPLSLGDTALIADVGIKYDVDIGYKVQALWGHSNFGKNNIVVLLSNDLKSINTVMLNKDENGAFDGTYITLESVNNLTQFGIQGADIWGDTLYVGGQIIENDINYHAICELSLTDYSQRIIKRKFYRDDGSVMGGCVQGIYVNDNSIWVFDNSDNPQTGECCYLTKYRR